MPSHASHFSISLSHRGFSHDWELLGVSGTVAIKGSIDTLKKLSSPLPSETKACVQLFSSAGIGGWEHISWGAYASLLAQQSKGMHFQKMELEWMGRLAGTFQLEEASRRVGVKEGAQEVVLVRLAPKDKENKKRLAATIKAISLHEKKVEFGKTIPLPKTWSRSAEEFAIERSALTGV